MIYYPLSTLILAGIPRLLSHHYAAEAFQARSQNRTGAWRSENGRLGNRYLGTTHAAAC